MALRGLPHTHAYQRRTRSSADAEGVESDGDREKTSHDVTLHICFPPCLGGRKGGWKRLRFRAKTYIFLVVYRSLRDTPTGFPKKRSKIRRIQPMRRRKIKKSKSKKLFRKTASRSHRMNNITRGGIGTRGGRRL